MKLFILETFFTKVLYFAPVFWLFYFLEFLTFTQIGILFSIHTILIAVLEIPTGLFADTYGRKKSIFVSYAIEIPSFFILFFTQSFLFSLIAFMLLSVSHSFYSGAKEAWVVDLLPAKKHYRFFQIDMSFKHLALFISGIIGYFAMSSFELKWIWIFGAISSILALIPLLFIPDVIEKKQKIQIKKITTYVLHKKHLQMLLILLSVGMIAYGMAGSIQWTAYIQSIGLDIASFGLLWSVMSIITIISQWIFTDSKKQTKRVMSLSFLLWGLSCISVLYIFNPFIAITVLLATVLFDFMRYPTERKLIQSFFTKKMRASLGSFESLVYAIAGGLGLFISGIIIDFTSPQTSIFISGIILVLISFCFIIINISEN